MEERVKEATKNVQVSLKCRLQKAKVTSQECCCPLRAGQKRKQGPDPNCRGTLFYTKCMINLE